MRSVVCHNVSLVFRHVSYTSTFEIENLNCPGSYYKKGKIRGGGVLWQDEMIWNWSTCQTRCSPPQSLDTAPPVFISNYDSNLLIAINSNLEKTDSHFNHEHGQLLSSACIFSGPIGGVRSVFVKTMCRSIETENQDKFETICCWGVGCEWKQVWQDKQPQNSIWHSAWPSWWLLFLQSSGWIGDWDTYWHT